jgi:hypothetical protein
MYFCFLGFFGHSARSESPAHDSVVALHDTPQDGVGDGDTTDAASRLYC